MKWKRNVLIGVAIVLVLIAISVCAYNHFYEESVEERRSVSLSQRRKILNDLLQILCESCKSIDAKPFLLYGTLLGYIRQKDFICYDFDIDVGVLENDYDKLYSQLQSNIIKYPDFWLKEKKAFGYRSLVIIHKDTQINCDISEFNYRHNMFRRNVPSLYSKFILKETQVDYPQDWILPLIPVVFNNQDIYIPNNPDALLRTYYGPDYLIPDHTCNLDCSECHKKI